MCIPLRRRKQTLRMRLHRQATWAARLRGLGSALRPKRHPGVGPLSSDAGQRSHPVRAHRESPGDRPCTKALATAGRFD
jgi:hypothetical protein